MWTAYDEFGVEKKCVFSNADSKLVIEAEEFHTPQVFVIEDAARAMLEAPMPGDPEPTSGSSAAVDKDAPVDKETPKR